MLLPQHYSWGGGSCINSNMYWILLYLLILFMRYSNASLLITRLMNYSLPNHKKISLPRQIFYPNFGIKRIYRHFFWNFIFYVQKTVILFRNCNFYVQNIQILWIIYICHFDNNICEWFYFFILYLENFENIVTFLIFVKNQETVVPENIKLLLFCAKI